jgi:osmoprotectant transport system substrate-binding protein
MDRRQIVALGGSLAVSCGRRRQAVRIGAKNFVEQDVLGSILAAWIERATMKTDLRLRLGGSLIAHQALIGGQLDLYPEYSGTALTACLKLPLGGGPREVFDRVKTAYAERHQVEWGWPLGFSNTFAMAVRREEGARSLGEAVTSGKRWRLGVGYEFEQRPDGWPAFVKAYPLALDGQLRTMDLGLLFRALAAGEVDMAAANSTDPQLASGAFRTLADDRQFFPPYEACLAVRQDALAAHPPLRATLDKLTGKIDETAMRRMNAAVVLEKRDASAVSREFVDNLGK